MKNKRFYKLTSIVLSVMLIMSCICPTLSVSASTTSTYVVAGVEELCGVNWRGDIIEGADNIMTQNADGTYSIVYTDVAVNNDYQLKVVENDSVGNMTWYGVDGGNDNVTFHVVEACDVTVTFNPNTLKITVTGDGVNIPTGLEIESIRTVGNGDCYWLNGANWDPAADENYMTETSDGIYEISYIEIEQFDNYQVKFAANNSWAINWGGVYAGSGVESDAVFNGDNITFDVPYELANVTIKLDIRGFDYATKTGAKFTITVTDATATEPTEAPETNELTVNATSNLFPMADATFNEDYSQVTVSYLINSNKDMLDCKWKFYYDTEKLAFNKKANLNSTGNSYNFMPQVSTGGVFNVGQEGEIYGNAVNLYLYPLSNNDKPVILVTVTFDIIGTGETTVNLDVEKLTVSAPDDTSMSDINQEEIIVESYCVQNYTCDIDLFTTIDGKKDTTTEPTITVEPTENLTTAPQYVDIIGDISFNLTDNGSGIYSGTTELTNGSYSFKINENGTEMGFGYTFTDSISGMIYSSDYKSSTVINATGGYYTFTYNINTNKLVVTYKPYPTEEPTTEPEPEITYIVAGSEELCGIIWDGTAEENAMTPNGDGTYSITFYDTLAYEYSLQLKVVENLPDGIQNWIGDKTGNNITFNIVSECDVTVTYNPDTNEITVTGDGVQMVTDIEIDTMRAVGNGDGTWLNGVCWDPIDDKNLMTEITDKVYTITYEDVEKFENYQVKFAANGSWNDNWGGIYQGSGIESEAVYNSMENITIDVPYELADITLTLDLSDFDYSTKTGAKFTVTVVDANPQPTTEPTTIQPTTTPTENTYVYFEVPTLEEWGTTKSVYCHIYNVYGGTPLKETSWMSKSEQCKLDSATGLYYFDTSKLGTIEDGADYALLFSTRDTDGNSHQTCNVTFGKECLGETVYVTGTMVENTEDSSKLDHEATWKKPELAKKYGAKAAITSTGKIVGKFFPIYQPKEQIVSQAIASWAVINSVFYTPEAVQKLCADMDVVPLNVYEQYESDYASLLADPENNPNLASLETVYSLLGLDNTATYIVAGSKELCGVSWDGGYVENAMTPNGDGTYSKVFTDVAIMNNYQFKVVENLPDDTQNWIGDIITHYPIVFDVISECDVTVTYNSSTQEITVTGDGVQMVTDIEIEAMRAVGNGDGAWLNDINWDPADDANLMTEITDRVYTITYEDVEEYDCYQVKFAANGSWNDNWGGIYEGSGIESEAIYNSSDNITVDVPYELANVTVTLDLTNFDYVTKTGAKFTVTVEDATQQPTTEPTTEPVPTTNELTVNATSNFFTSQTATYNNRTNKLVVTYYIQSVKDLLNTQWEMTYDSDVLSVSNEINTKDTICPSFTTSNALTINDGIIKFNTYNLSLFDISSEEKVFARVVFNVNDFEALGIYNTTINLNVINLTVSALDNSTFMTDENEEVKVVYNGKYDDTYNLITSKRVEMIGYEIPKYIGDVDNTGAIDIHDATKLAKHIAELSTLTEEQLLVADCDGDGIISVKDVTFIQLYLVDAVNYGNVGKEYKF